MIKKYNEFIKENLENDDGFSLEQLYELNESKHSGKTIKDIKTDPEKDKITITFEEGGKLVLMSKMGTNKTGHDKAEIYIWS